MELYKIVIKRLVFIETTEDSNKWLCRARRQWGSGKPIAVRVTENERPLGISSFVTVEKHDGWVGAEWESDMNLNADGGMGTGVSSHGLMLVLEIVGGEREGSTLGMGIFNGAPLIVDKRHCAKFPVFMFPTQTTIDQETVYAILEFEVRSNALSGEVSDGLSTLEYDFGSVRVSTLNFYFPSFMLTKKGEYTVSSVISAMNVTEDASLAMQLVSLSDARYYISAVPAHVITVKPRQRVYFAATWRNGEQASTKKLQMHLAINGSRPPSSPIIVNVHNSIPQPLASDTPYHFWVNTTCVTNRHFSLSQELPLLLALLPAFGVSSELCESGAGAEGIVVALDKDRGLDVLFRADGVPIAAGLGKKTNANPYVRTCYPFNGLPETSDELASPHLSKTVAFDRPFLDLSQKTCQCVIHLGTILGFPMVYESARGTTPSFQVDITLLDQKGWHIIAGETQPRHQSASGSLQWEDKLILCKWPGAESKQFIRLNLTEVGPHDGDTTPMGAALVSINRLDRTQARVNINVAFHVYETYSLYDTLHTSSLLMRGAFVTFSELSAK
ncbi:hypothetical protein ERJ75_000136800 [Trypanosoma vivax]|uniref:Uncharacterized protein n=1 Tax=Trypanosoma vivax (strain Y486) TaxID=1055687 RepID=G0TW95_TRYVY|nr:hypothetical protein TRVL_02510 [Trypanosoma vivax]KAH8619776.1 hypothetical protein ERJ75_000136800 [Trypanosoma vivax]CCC48233.1 conserved hypothetical protein [Trypanosoma vivax Y486]